MERSLWYAQAARGWNEALPLGNGHLGAMVFGGAQDERLALNHDTLWSGFPQGGPLPDVSAFTRSAAEKALLGDAQAAQRILEEHVCGPFFESYLPLGDLLLHMEGAGAPENYRRELDLESATAMTCFSLGEERVRRRAFVSRPADALVLTLDFLQPCTFTFALDTQLRGTDASVEGLLLLRGDCPSRVEPNYVTHPDPVRYDPEHPGMRFAFGLRVETDGTQVLAGGKLHVTNATRATAVLMAETSFRGFDQDPADPAWDCLRRLKTRLAGCSMDADALLAAHVADYQALETTCALTLDAPESPLPTNERLVRFDGTDLGLAALLFRYGRYLLIASSRPGDQPANLQGIWNAEMRAPWSSNYTLNINTEMNYWPACVTNLRPCTAPLSRMVKELAVTGAEVARKVHGAPGFCTHHNTDLWRHAAPVGDHETGSAVYGFWPMGGAWLSRMVWERQEFFPDETYLKETALPCLKGTAEFLLSQLREDSDGLLCLCPATSAENNFLLDGAPVAVDASTAMMQAMTMDVLLCYAKACEQAGLGAPAGVVAALSRLRPVNIGPDGRVVEWHVPREESEPHHRHLSPLYGLYPAQLFAVPGPLAEAARQTLLKRGDEGTGWSLAWKVCLWARLLDGEHAWKILQMQLRPVDVNENSHLAGGGSYPNLFCAHPPFQIDGNFGVTAGMAEMLLQSDDAGVTLLPALPRAWRSGSLTGARARGGLTVDLKWRQGRVTACRLKADEKGDFRVTANGRWQTVHLSAGETVDVTL